MAFTTMRFRLREPEPEPELEPGPGFAEANPSHSASACDRCRRLKKKCSRSVPECAGCVHAGRRCAYRNLQARGHALAQVVAGPALIPTTDSVLVDAFFHHVYRAYPFIDEERVRQASFSGLDTQDTESVTLYMIMAIGYTSLQRTGKAPPVENGFDIPYPTLLQQCIMHESIDSIQILLLLALYSLFDPTGPSTWSIVGVITRQALAQGLTRAQPDNLPPKTVELRRRLFWSIFGLDRMMAVSVGAAPGLVSDEMDIPFPAITVQEFASETSAENASMLQVSRHVIELRQLESKILGTVHLQRRLAVSALTQTDRQSITARLRAEIENWYSQGCLISRPELDNVRLHDTMGWLNARYYHLLLLLYYPCQFNAGAARVTGLVELVRKFTQYNCVLLGHQQLSLNRVTLSRLFPPCLVLVYCLARGGDTYSIRGVVCALVDILNSFPEQWIQARHLSEILTRLDECIMDMNQVHAIRQEMVTLLGDTLGKASCYQDTIDEEIEQSFTRPADESPNMSFIPIGNDSMGCSFL